jgi:hypothetical protein
MAEFHENRALEKFDIDDLPAFPAKTWVSDLFRSEPDTEIVGERQRTLESYFRTLLTLTKYLPLRKALSKFLSLTPRDNEERLKKAADVRSNANVHHDVTSSNEQWLLLPALPSNVHLPRVFRPRLPPPATTTASTSSNGARADLRRSVAEFNDHAFAVAMQASEFASQHANAAPQYALSPRDAASHFGFESQHSSFNGAYTFNERAHVYGGDAHDDDAPRDELHPMWLVTQLRATLDAIARTHAALAGTSDAAQKLAILEREERALLVAERNLRTQRAAFERMLAERELLSEAAAAYLELCVGHCASALAWRELAVANAMAMLGDDVLLAQVSCRRACRAALTCVHVRAQELTRRVRVLELKCDDLLIDMFTDEPVPPQAPVDTVLPPPPPRPLVSSKGDVTTVATTSTSTSTTATPGAPPANANLLNRIVLAVNGRRSRRLATADALLSECEREVCDCAARARASLTLARQTAYVREHGCEVAASTQLLARLKSVHEHVAQMRRLLAARGADSILFPEQQIAAFDSVCVV